MNEFITLGAIPKTITVKEWVESYRLKPSAKSRKKNTKTDKQKSH